MYGLAWECYKALQTRLLENSGYYFFGNRPTVIDAALYANLYSHYRPVLANKRLFQILRDEFPKLIEYTLKVHADFMDRPLHVDDPGAGDDAAVERLPSFWMKPDR